MTALVFQFAWRFQFAFMVGGLVCFSILAFIFAAVFTPNHAYGLLSDAHDKVDTSRYALTWENHKSEIIGQPLGRDEKIAYGRILSKVFASGLRNTDARLAEDQARSSLSSIDLEDLDKQRFRLQSKVTPRLFLQNRSLAVFDIETALLSVRYSGDGLEVIDSQLETIRETVRVANTRTGLTIRHMEPLDRPFRMYPHRPELSVRTKKLAGVNYYPASSPWSLFWRDFPKAEIEADLLRIKHMGANSIRIFLTHESFEDPDLRKRSFENLEMLLDIAASLELSLIVTCFDLGVDYHPDSLSANWAHLSALLEALSGNPAVAVIDLKNEADLDYAVWGEAYIQLWLSTLLHLAQNEFPEFQYTIGWSSAEAARALSSDVDIISFHDYLDPKGLAQRLNALKQIVDGKPVMLTEIGHSRWPSLPFAPRQDEKISTQLDTLLDIDGVFVWTLHDFERVPNAVAGWRPWRKAMQAHYGLSEKSHLVLFDFFTRFLAHNPTHTDGDLS